MEVYLNIVQIIISVALVAIILLQVRSGGLGGVFGGTETAVYKTRRGVERTLFNITIGLSVAFFVITMINVIVTG
ncbi:MAG: preprotein translocase subunit SecG [Chloroflexi bacterium]|nr:MAG: preprotein translocase subunit SecG [Anaerolineaceae bacterium 4572_32.2]RLC72840.1 MAG: preprotein translocase subunit SecG [Chloroflexota bacterium]RLC84307.1 MAG: preprotein translocase subunit SecG [Chloroflexota bacterium]HEY72055.1 preprotein translocase subunit SecG [Thermoflexia bacterium]